MVKTSPMLVVKLAEAKQRLGNAISDVIGECAYVHQRRRVDKVLGPSGLPIESIMTAQSVFVKIPIRFAYAHRKRALLSNARFGPTDYRTM